MIKRDAEFYIRMGERLRIAREIRKLTQKETGDALAISQQAIARIETGRQGVNAHQLLLFCRLLHVSPNLILTGQAGRFN